MAPGELGLRQSEALFSHVKRLPELADNLPTEGKIIAVGASETPRETEGSYMPCFLSGVASAESIAAVSGAPLYRFSHQCGHIMAAIYSSGRYDLLNGEFAAFHVSGGTTELVKVIPEGTAFKTELLGGSADLNAGQIIDRIGVYAGLDFPAGPALESHALKNTARLPRKKISARGMTVNLSGLENMAVQLFDGSGDIALTAAFVFDYIGRSIVSMMDAYTDSYGETSFILAGGVMCNSIIKGLVSEKYDAAFAEPMLSADNAVGIAALALRAYRSLEE